MKKNLTILVVLLALTQTTYSQVGIGTSNPQGFFHVDGQSNNPISGNPSGADQADDFIVTSNGSVGIGITTPAQKLDVIGTIRADDKLMVGTSWTGGGALSVRNNESSENIATFVGTDNVFKATLKDNGYLGLITNTPTEALDVAKGNVRVREINTNQGNVNNKRVVADANGVLKTLPNQSPVLVGGDLNHPYNPVSVTTNNVSNSVTAIVRTFSFTLQQQSLVTFEHVLTASTTGPNWSDGSRRALETSIEITSAPSSASNFLNKEMCLSSISIPGNTGPGISGVWRIGGSQTLLLPVGTYTAIVQGKIQANSNASNVSATFGTGDAGRLTVTAIPMNN